MVYFCLVFLAGFLLGTVRMLIVAPRIGETAAVLLESPVILALSWVVSLWCVRRYQVPASLIARFGMGAIAFVLLQLAEMGLSVLAIGRSLEEHFAGYGTAAGMIGGAAQIVFAAFPFAQRNRA